MASALNGRQSCLWLISWAVPTYSCVQIHPGGLSHLYFCSPVASDVERAQINAMQREEDKRPGEGAESVIIIFRLAFTTSHKPCRTISNPVQARTSNVKFKVDHRRVNSSKGEYSCSGHLHNINRPNLQCVKQQSTVHGKWGEWGEWTLEFHERTSWKPERRAD